MTDTQTHPGTSADNQTTDLSHFEQMPHADLVRLARTLSADLQAERNARVQAELRVQAISKLGTNFLNDLTPIEEFPGYAPTAAVNWNTCERFRDILKPVSEPLP